MTPFISSPENAIVRRWAKLGDIWVSAEPLIDSTDADQLYCRFTWKEANEAATSHGWRLITAAEVDAIRDDALSPGGIMLTPHTLPTSVMTAAAGIRAPNWQDANDVATYQQQVQHLLNANMASREWCAIHDGAVRAEAAGMGDGSRILMNAGKWYVKGLSAANLAGPPAGRAWLKGWWLVAHPGVPGRYIQAGPRNVADLGPHSDTGSRDYGTLTMVASDTDPGGAA